MFQKFFPKEFDFFSLFDKQAEFAVEAAKRFKEIASLPGVINEEAYKTIQDLEHRADQTSHTIIDQLNKTFITPFDREDIHVLSKELDDITDMINTMARRMKIYKISGGDRYLVEFASLIEESVSTVAKAVKGMRIKTETMAVLKACVEVNRLENIGDALRDRVLSDLFENSKNPIEVIKWKENYQDAESVLDICEDVAHVIESILVKQG